MWIYTFINSNAISSDFISSCLGEETSFGEEKTADEENKEKKEGECIILVDEIFLKIPYFWFISTSFIPEKVHFVDLKKSIPKVDKDYNFYTKTIP